MIVILYLTVVHCVVSNRLHNNNVKGASIDYDLETLPHHLVVDRLSMKYGVHFGNAWSFSF